MTPKRSADLRTFFRRRRRVVPEKEVGLVADKPKTLGGRNPLYAAPSGLGELAVDFDIRSEGETSQNISSYLELVKRDPSKYHGEETSKLTLLVNSIGLVDLEIPTDASTLVLRLVRKLLLSELRRIASQDEEESTDTIERWLSSNGFWCGMDTISKVIESRAIVANLAPAASWDVFMLIESVIKAEPLIGIDSVISGLLALQERLLLHHNVWQGDVIYTLLQRERTPITRSRCSSVSSPGKALHAITHPVPAGVTPLEFFFRKFLRAAAAIVEHLVVSLDLSIQVRQASWTLFVSAIEEELSLRMMHNRHLLTIMACTVYSTAKLFDEDRSFAHIIATMQKQYPALGEDWYRNVSLDNVTDQSDLVIFYNMLYLERMRERIYALNASSGTPVKNPPGTPFPKTLGSVALSRNVTLDVSPGPLKHATGTPTCIAILGNLGARRRPVSSSPNKVARRLHF